MVILLMAMLEYIEPMYRGPSRGPCIGTIYDAPILDTDTPILILRYGDTAAEKNKDSPILQVYKKLINKNNNEDN